MGYCLQRYILRIMMAVLLLPLMAASAFAAGEWEWTEDQGWMRGAGVARPTPQEQLHYAYELEQNGEYMDAAQQYFLLVQNFPASEEAGVGLQRLARCLFEMENYYTSYKAIEQVIETYPNTGRMSDLVEIELRIAKKLMVSQTPDLLSDDEANTRAFNIRRGLEIIASVIEHDPYGPVAAEAYLAQGEGHLFLNEVQQARKSFETIRDEFPRSDVIERARLGILQCDSLLGNARPQEVAEQMEIVRETERERMEGRQEFEEMDDVENTIRNFNEIEAEKLLDQAEQYRRMGTRKHVQASEFLFKEIVRRYPGSPQAEDAAARLGNIQVPNEENRLARIAKNINLNPFSYNRDREPEWIVPQLKSEDMVMVDSGIGPIVGVPETGDLIPQTSNAASVSPAALQERQRQAALFSPASAAPAPGFIDGVGGQRTYSSDPALAAGPAYPPPNPGYSPPPPTGQPLFHAPDDDLVLPGGGGGGGYGQTPMYGGNVAVGIPPPQQGYYPAPQQYQQGGYAPVPGYGGQPPPQQQGGWTMANDFR